MKSTLSHGQRKGSKAHEGQVPFEKGIRRAMSAYGIRIESHLRKQYRHFIPH